jgi:hypothetical protein
MVLNDHGLKTIRGKCPSAKVFARRGLRTYPMRKITKNLRLGVATNASFQATEQQIKLIDKIRLDLGVSRVQIRLHPNSKLNESHFSLNCLEIADKNELLEQYIQKVDLVIVGNSAVQLKLLCLGIPIVHIYGLDTFRFDLYGYCKRGFSYGVEEGAIVSLEHIQKFYQSAWVEDRIKAYISVSDKLPSVAQFQLTQ